MRTTIPAPDSEKSPEKKERVLSRRDFLKGGAAVAALAAATATGATKIMAQTPAPTPTPTPTPSPTATAETFIFFNAVEAATIKAIFGRLIPGNAQDPGAVEAGAHIYLDRALNGAYSRQAVSYQVGLAAVNAYSQTRNQKKFADLTAAEQDAILVDMQDGKATGFTFPTSTAFFSTLLRHVREGTFCDPIYGGNQNLVGWKMVGYPGAQFAYTDLDERIGADQAQKPIVTLAEHQKIPHPEPQSGF